MTLRILVLGVQRSGTSMMARVLDASGIDLGRPYLSRNEHNVEGFFESMFFSIFLRTEIVRHADGSPRLANGIPYKATAEDIEKLTAFLETYDGQGYKHTYGLVLWPLFRAVLQPEAVVVLTWRKRREVIKSMAKVWPYRPRSSFEKTYDKLTTLQAQVAEEWPHIIWVDFNELTTRVGQMAIQKRFNKHFPKLKLNFSSISSKKKRKQAKREKIHDILTAKHEGETDEHQHRKT